MAVSYFGRPRTTMDLDLVIMTRPEDFEKLVGVIRRAGLKASKKKIASAWQSGYRMVTCLDKRSPYSLDIILSVEPLQRVRGSLLGIQVFYQKPEDLILAKLRMIRSTEDPERKVIDKSDVRSILVSRKINLGALMDDAKRQGTATILQELLRGKNQRKSR
jgi:hypothetical protein